MNGEQTIFGELQVGDEFVFYLEHPAYLFTKISQDLIGINYISKAFSDPQITSSGHMISKMIVYRVGKSDDLVVE